MPLTLEIIIAAFPCDTEPMFTSQLNFLRTGRTGRLAPCRRFMKECC